MSLGKYRRAAALLAAMGVVGGASMAPAYAADGSGGSEQWSPIGIAAAGDCTFPAPNVSGTPWSLQRVLLDQLWQVGSGKGVKVAVIDTGVDDSNPQLQGAVQDGGSLLTDPSTGQKGNGVTDPVGHGTKVAGIIAARPAPNITGFAGLAKDATILSIRQNDSQGDGNVDTLTQAIDLAITDGAQVINISQDVRGTGGTTSFTGSDKLEAAITKAEKSNVVVVASSGNDGREAEVWPAAYSVNYPNVLAVGASDRNNERASFSEYGDFVSVAAPGVDMLSTVPKGGQCVDNGTSFSAPYVAGLVAIIKGERPTYSAAQIRTVIEQTAQRTDKGANKLVGWGVVDPLKAALMAKNTDNPPDQPHPDAAVKLDTEPIIPQPLGLAETQADRDRRTGTYVLGLGGLLVAGLAGGSIVVRDYRRRQAR